MEKNASRVMTRRRVYVVADNILSPLGTDTATNWTRLTAGDTGISVHENRYARGPYAAALFDAAAFAEAEGFTRFESLLLASAREALSHTKIDPRDPRTAFLVSSTKGNISLLETGLTASDAAGRIGIWRSAGKVAQELGVRSEPVVVSHACISGLLALITGLRMIRAGVCDHAIVSGADLITQFILSGFQSFHAVSANPCRPFDAARDGITLGEGAATVILSARPPASGEMELAGGAVTNDANHISGPSRTGEELFLAMDRAMREAGVTAADIDFISAHGTATRYNDDMEAKAVNLAGLASAPLNSLKGYYGHTLGAAGLIESVVSMQSIRENRVLATRGFADPGTEKPVNVTAKSLAGKFDTCLKTASGFGGCNAAVVLRKTPVLSVS